MTTYAPNAFTGQGAPSGQGALPGALRSYAPNRFAGTRPGGVTNMAPHLSVAAADRPFAAEIEQLRGAGHGDKMPDLDMMWGQSPDTYQAQVANLLRQPGAAMELAQLNRPPPVPQYIRDDEGNIRYRTDDEGNRSPMIRREGDE